MTKLWYLIVLCLLPGCAVLEEHGGEIEQIGETLTETAPAINAVQPDIGLGILIVGGLLVALGKLLQKKKTE